MEDRELEEAYVKAWRWATWLADGCWPPQTDDVVRVARLRGAGRVLFGDRLVGITERVKRYPVPGMVEPPLDAMPEKFTFEDLMKVVEANRQ